MTSYRLDLLTQFDIHPVVNIEYLKPYHPSPERFGPREMVRMELPEGLESAVWRSKKSGVTEMHAVDEKVLRHWKGRPDHDDTWQKQENVKDLVTSYWVRQHIDQLPRTRVSPNGQKKKATGTQGDTRRQ